MLLTIYKGTHFSIPQSIQFFVKEVEGTATFTQDSVYDLRKSICSSGNYNHQVDWNKLAGISFNPIVPDSNSIMVAWRYNIDKNMFEVGPFFNVNGTRMMPFVDEILTIPMDEQFKFTTDYEGITISYKDKTIFKPTPKLLKPNFSTSYRISSWFGGTCVAPRTLSFIVNYS